MEKMEPYVYTDGDGVAVAFLAQILRRRPRPV